MKGGWLVAVVPPAIIAAVALLLFPLSHISTGGWIGVAFLLLAYVMLITAPAAAPRSEKSFIFSGSSALAVYPSLVAAAIIALVGVAISAVPWQWILAADIVVAGLTAIVIVGVSAASQKDAHSHVVTKRQVNDLRLMASTVEECGSTISDPAEALFARKVAEQLRLSPFLGVPESAVLEADVALAVTDLQLLSSDGDTASMHSTLERISSLIRRRNEIVKLRR